VHPAADVDGVDLDIAVVGNRSGHARRPFIKEMSAPQEPARLGARGLYHVCHGFEGRVGWDLDAGPAAGTTAGTWAMWSALIWAT